MNTTTKTKRTQETLLACRKIKARLVEAGIQQIDIARELGLSRCYVSGVVNGTHFNRRIEARVAELLGEDPARLWAFRNLV